MLSIYLSILSLASPQAELIRLACVEVPCHEGRRGLTVRGLAGGIGHVDGLQKAGSRTPPTELPAAPPCCREGDNYVRQLAHGQSNLCGEIPLTFRAIRDVDPKLLHMSHVLLFLTV